MPSFETIAGHRFYIGPQLSAGKYDFIEADFAGLSWTEIDGWIEKGEYGDEYELIEEALINRGRVAKIKGTANGGSMENIFVTIDNDPGQLTFIAASRTRKEYAFKIERGGEDGLPIKAAYFTGLAMSARRLGGDANTSDRRNFTVEITSNLVEMVGEPVPMVALTVAALSTMMDNVPAGTQVATFSTDAETVTISGADAARVQIVGNTIRTVGSLSGRTSLVFTIVGTAPDKVSNSRTVYIPLTIYVAPPATLTVNVVTGLFDNIPAGTTVANFTTNGSVAVTGTDAARVEVVGTSVRTTQAVTGRAYLSFTLTATGAGMSPQARSVSVPLTAYVPGTVVLAVSPVSNLQETAPIGTVVATFTTDGTPALSGTDAGILAISGNSVVTTAALTDKGTLQFTVTATDTDKTPASENVYIVVAEVAPPTVALVVAPTNNLDATAPVGTIVASYQTNATQITITGEDAALVGIGDPITGGGTIVTVAAISAGTLDFTLTGTAPDMLSQARNVVVTIAAEPAPTITYSTDATAVTGLWVGYADETLRATAILPNATEAQLVVSQLSDLSDPISGPVVTVQPGGYFLGTCPGLQRDTNYYCGIRVGNVIYTARKGQFKTMPVVGQPHSFRFGFGCCNTGTSSSAFTAMRGFDPLFVQHLGDFHYANIAQNDASLYHAAINGRMTLEMGAMMEVTPTFWIWDDHDFGPDGSDMTDPGRPAALATYKARVPSPPRRLAGADDPIDYAYTVGRIHFIVPDGRSQRIRGTRYFHPDQITWIENEMIAARDAGRFICLCIGLPWFSGEFPASDRARIGNFIAANNLEGRVFSINGDAHAIQVDDGTNVQIATVGSARIPSIHAAPFSQGNSVKGQTTWSHGRYIESTNQGGYIDVTDTGGDEITLNFVGYKDAGTTVVTFEFPLSRLGYVAGPNYSIVADKATANEGETVTFNITSNQPNEIKVVNITGVEASDIVSGLLAYSVTLDSTGAGSFSLTLAEDLSTEGVQTLTATVEGSNASTSVTVADTSVGEVIPPGTIPSVIQYDRRHLKEVNPAESTVVLDNPATAGNLLILFALAEKNMTVISPPAGFTLLASHTGTGCSAYLYSKIAEGGEIFLTTSFSGNGTNQRVCYAVETDAAAIDQCVLGTANASVTGRGATVTAPVAANTLAIATWHNDTWNTSSGATDATIFGPEWTILDAGGITATYPAYQTDAFGPAAVLAIRPIADAGDLTAALSYVGGTSDESIVTLTTVRY